MSSGGHVTPLNKSSSGQKVEYFSEALKQRGGKWELQLPSAQHGQHPLCLARLYRCCTTAKGRTPQESGQSLFNGALCQILVSKSF